MGQKVNPIGLRLGINRNWDSMWFAGNDYPKLLAEDNAIRTFLMDRLKAASISKVIIERPNKKCRVYIHSARPGVIIGKKGAEIETLRKEIQQRSGADVSLNIVEVRKPDLDANLIAQGIADQLERRIAFRRAMRRGMQNAMQNGAQGIRTQCSGRLGGAEIARREWYKEGSVPMHKLRADIDYGFAQAHTTYGVIGVQVWVHLGEKYAIDYPTNVQ
jgi:small subunit ribosomal protein S3